MPLRDSGNSISEWFGHRIYPNVVATPTSVADMRSKRCPFLSLVKGHDQECVKNEKSKGVCTISACSNGPRQDWVACPYRVFDPQLIRTVAARLYSGEYHALPGPRLAERKNQTEVLQKLRSGNRVLLYFDAKIGGEVSISATERSPEVAFDVTLVELSWRGGSVGIGRFAILEVQTMDFHGSYGRAVAKLRSGLELHPRNFPRTLQQNLWWAGDGIEGPNIANVFKRTFYQMMFKFNFGLSDACAGTALVISQSVWDSWQPFLAAPELTDVKDGTWRLTAPGEKPSGRKVPAWIYVFDIKGSARRTPSPLSFVRTIGLSADALGYYALKAAPAEASRQLMSHTGIYATLKRRIEGYWPNQEMEVVGSQQ